MNYRNLMGMTAAVLLATSAAHADVKTVKAALNAGVAKLLADTSAEATQVQANGVDCALY